MQLHRRTHNPAETIARAKDKLGTLGMEVPHIEPILHETHASFRRAARAYRAEDPSRWNASRISLVVVDKFMAAAFVSEVTRQMHVRKSSPTAEVGHELVHAHDFNSPSLSLLINRLVEDRRAYPSNSLAQTARFRVRELLTTAFFEGRAVRCEEAIAETFQERLSARKKVASLPLAIFTGSAVAFLTAYSDLVFDIASTFHRLFEAGKLMAHWPILTGIFVGAVVTTTFLVSNLLTMVWIEMPYAIGHRFMKKVERAVGTLQKTLKITEQNPPTPIEVLMPSRYIRRLELGQEN